AIARADLFEVTDRDGHVMATVGSDASVPEGRDVLVREVLEGHPFAGVLVQPEAHYQVALTPVFAGGRVVGSLLIGARIGRELAERLRQLTRSEVTFVSNGTATGSTLEYNEDREAVLSAVTRHALRARADSRGGLLEVHAGRHLYLTLVSSLPQSGSGGTQFYAMQRSIDAETGFLRATQTELLGIGVAAVLIALLAGFLIAERITAPVQRLVLGAQEMEHGNYDFPLAVSSGDEIGELARRFEGMRRVQREYVHNLKEVARMKSEFISVASHELRTPLSVIEGFHELMIEGKLGDVTPQQKRALEATLRSVATLTRIAEDATRMAQIDSSQLVLKRSEYQVATLMEQVMVRVRTLAAGRRVTLTCSMAEDLPAVHVDGPSLVQALVNLVSNGIRFTPDGGRVDVRAASEGTWLEVWIHDSGVGIDVERQRHLLERPVNPQNSLHHHSSSTLEFNSNGLGLGLSIARGIIEAHGGTLAIESAPGKGTTLQVRLPCGPQAMIERAA
ncbi:MAG: ATP-binding protein, partial [Micromonosporaceae bacterium]